MRPTVSSASPQISSVRTRVRPIGACRVLRARYQPIAAAIAGRLPMTECASRRLSPAPRCAAVGRAPNARRLPGPCPRRRVPAAICDARSVSVAPDRPEERAERERMRDATAWSASPTARASDRQCPATGCYPSRARRGERYDGHGVVNQRVYCVVDRLSRVRPCTGRVAALREAAAKYPVSATAIACKSQ